MVVKKKFVFFIWNFVRFVRVLGLSLVLGLKFVVFVMVLDKFVGLFVFFLVVLFKFLFVLFVMVVVKLLNRNVKFVMGLVVNRK